LQMVASGYGVTLLPEVAIDVEVRDERVKLLRFVEPQPRRNIGLAWRPTSSRKADFLELGRILLDSIKCEAVSKCPTRSRRRHCCRQCEGRRRPSGGEPAAWSIVSRTFQVVVY